MISSAYLAEHIVYAVIVYHFTKIVLWLLYVGEAGDDW